MPTERTSAIMKFDAKVRKQVLERDGGACVRCGHVAVDVHHRKLRGMGGSGKAEVVNNQANLILLCRACHAYVHQNPREAYDTGYLVHSWDNPEMVGVIRKNHSTVTFRSDGTFEQTEVCEFLPG